MVKRARKVKRWPLEGRQVLLRPKGKRPEYHCTWRDGPGGRCRNIVDAPDDRCRDHRYAHLKAAARIAVRAVELGVLAVGAREILRGRMAPREGAGDTAGTKRGRDLAKGPRAEKHRAQATRSRRR